MNITDELIVDFLENLGVDPAVIPFTEWENWKTFELDIAYLLIEDWVFDQMDSEMMSDLEKASNS